MDKIFKNKNKMAEIQDGRYSSGLYKNKWYAPICLDAPLYIHNTKKACFFRLRGCPYAPYIWMPPYVWMPPCTLGCPHMFGWPPVCLDAPHMTPCMFGHHHIFGYPCIFRVPLCLDAPCMLGHPHRFGYPHMFG